MDRGFARAAGAYPASPGEKAFTATGVYDKVGVLVVLMLASGTVGYFVKNPALILVGIFGALGLALLGIFKPTTAPVVAPLYSLVEGFALGGITAYYASTSGSGIVPLAVIFTGGIFLGTLVVFRSGLVKVTPRFVSMTMIALVGFLVLALALAFGLPVPGLSGAGGLAVFGVIGVVVGVMCLFLDFNFVQVGEQRGLPATAEWSGALMLMISLAFVYLNVLRVLARRR
jgi:uncharacterized YccA/Bax inhibitor family protein